MKKGILKVLGLLGLGGLALASCSNSNDVKPQIVVAVNQDTGTTFQAIKLWMDQAAEDLNFEWHHTVMSTRDNAANLSTLQNELLNGTNGIISMVDMDAANLQKLLSDLDKNNAYYAGLDTELANAKNGNLLSNSRIVGTVTDGESGASRGETLFDEVVKTNNRKIVFGQYSTSFFPNVIGAVDAFIAKANEYNETHDDDFVFYKDETSANYINDSTTYQFNFGQTLSDAEYNKWKDQDVDAVVCVNSVTKLVLPKTVTDNDPIEIFSVGFDDETQKSLGGNVLKTLSQTPSEVIFYPLVQILNAINGKTYSDAPTTPEGKVVTGHYIYITNQNELTQAANKIMNFSNSTDLSKCLIQPSEVKSMLAGEEGATFQKLVDKLDSWTSSNLFA